MEDNGLRIEGGGVIAEGSERRRAHHGSVLAIGVALCGVGSLLFTLANAADASKGAKVYENKCSTCHGKAGKGDGPTAPSLDKRPRNFTEPGFLAKKTDEDLKKTILEGKPPMPAFRGTLKERDINEVIPYIRRFGTPK